MMLNLECVNKDLLLALQVPLHVLLVMAGACIV